MGKTLRKMKQLNNSCILRKHVIFFQHKGPIPTVLQKLEVDIYSNLVCGLRFDTREHICFGASVGGVCHVSTK